MYKARDRDTGKIVALKKVRFDTSEPESIKFMAREIMILQKLDHPNIIKLEGLATSRMQYSLYIVFEYMQSDLTSIISRPDMRLSEAQVSTFSIHNSFQYLMFAIAIADFESICLCVDKVLHATATCRAGALPREGYFASRH